MDKKNLFGDLPSAIQNEVFEEIVRSKNIKIERIISRGQRTPIGEWYDQELNEFVILIKGRANILFEDNYKLYELKPGDYLNIPAHTKHRVEWTDEKSLSVWLAVHYI